MDVWELKRQIAYKASLLAWSDPPGALVYSGGAFVSEDLEGAFSLGSFLPDGPAQKVGTDNVNGATPFCRVRCTGFDFDLDVPGRIRSATFELWTTCGAGGPTGPGSTTQARFDSHGINLVTGSLRNDPQGSGKSFGRDVDEALMRLAESQAATFTDTADGFQGYCEKGDAMIAVSGVQYLKRSLVVRAQNPTTSRFYHFPTGFTATAAGGGVVNLGWRPAPKRFDSFATVLRRGANPGDPAPATPSAGVGIVITGTNSTSDSGLTHGATYNYSLFQTYAETPQAVAAATADRVSAPNSLSVVVS